MRYREVGLLAEGGMAVIARAETDDGATVVVKRVRPPYCFDPSFLRLFADEGAVHAALDHENIVRLLDRGEDEAGPFLVFEHVDGTDLAHVLQDAPALDLECVLAIAVPLFRALAAAHTACGAGGACLEVVHRDVSPGNVLLGEDGSVKLADFGVASFALKNEHTVAGEMKGKFAYMAPEQTRGEKVGPRADLFAAGVVLWECLAGQRLFDGPTDADVVAAVRQQPAARLDERRRDLPVELVTLVAALLDKVPERRPAGAGDVVTTLQGIVLTLGLDEGLARHAARLARAAPRPALPHRDVDARRRTQRVVGADTTPTGALVVRRSQRPRLALVAGVVAGAALVAFALGNVIPTDAEQQVVRLPDEPAAASSPPTQPTASAAPAVAPSIAPMGPAPAATTRPPAAPPVARPQPLKERPAKPLVPAVVPAVVRAAGFGKLSIATEPWATVTVDGALVDKETPLVAFTLPAGAHVVVLENPVYGLRRTLSLDIPADGEVKRFVDLNRP